MSIKPSDIKNDVMLIEDELFEMSNLFSRTTGVGTSSEIFISPKRGSHGPRIKVMDRDQNEYGLSISDDPQIVYGVSKDSAVLKQAKAWIILNKDVLLDHWNKLTDGAEVTKLLKRLP